MDSQQKLEELTRRLEQLLRDHQRTNVELIKLREEIKQIKRTIQDKAPLSKPLQTKEVSYKKTKEEDIPEVDIDFSKKIVPPPLPKQKIAPSPKSGQQAKKSFNLEEFIGGNLINKVGILILIVGLGLFVKYAIDNGFFPPLVRLILSFLAGLALVGFGYRLKSKYKTYSAVLFSGGMAVLYFSAYGGNAFYDPVLLPRVTAFILMVVFTIVTVLAAMMYNQQIIALLGLVGAYAVPFLLGDDSGDYKLLLAYIAIINTGILLVSIRKLWRLSLYIALLLTWLIFAFWAFVEFEPATETQTAWIFNGLYFLIFYAALVIYNVLHHKQFTFDNVLFITINAFIFYGLGMYLLDELQQEYYQGLFTLINGLLHLAIAYGMYRKTTDKKLFFVLSGLFWVFLTISIGVQFDGNISALLWLGQAAVLLGIGRRFKEPIYEVGFILVAVLGMVLLSESWNEGYMNSSVHHTVLFNSYFLSSVLALVVLGVMLWIDKKWPDDQGLGPFSRVLIPMVFVGTLYLSFALEILHQYDQAFLNSEIDGLRDFDIRQFGYVWLINYSLAFVIVLSLFNQLYLKNKNWAGGLLVMAFLSLVVSLSVGILLLNDLRTEYLKPELNPEFIETSYWIWIRYITYLLMAGVLFCFYKMLEWFKDNKALRSGFELFSYLIILVILSNELTTFMTAVIDVDADSLTHRVGYSILWALFSAIMIFIGFKRRNKLLRVAAIVLFGVTLLKVFLLDLVDISTESRILLFVAIGVLLLITSYFYQKYSDVLLGGEDDAQE